MTLQAIEDAVGAEWLGFASSVLSLLGGPALAS